MNETFPHYYEDGYLITNHSSSGWPIVTYYGLYRETNTMPYQWNTSYKRAKPVAIFVTSQWRTRYKEGKKIIYGCDVIYKYSAN